MKETLQKSPVKTSALVAVATVATLLAFSERFSQPSPTAPSVPASQSSAADLPPPHADSNAEKILATIEHTTATVHGKASTPAESAALQFLQHGLNAYYAGELEHEDKLRLENTLRELNTSPMGRAFIVDTFFSTDSPRLADIMHELILDADLKDASLILALIDRDKTGFTPGAQAKIIDLIADMTAQKGHHYSPEIDDYLAQLSLHPDTTLRDAAKSQRAWYIAHHQPYDAALVGEYLLDSSPDIREEMYELIESRLSAKNASQESEIALALGALLHADYLYLSPHEKERIIALHQAFNTLPD